MRTENGVTDETARALGEAFAEITRRMLEPELHPVARGVGDLREKLGEQFERIEQAFRAEKEEVLALRGSITKVESDLAAGLGSVRDMVAEMQGADASRTDGLRRLQEAIERQESALAAASGILSHAVAALDEHQHRYDKQVGDLAALHRSFEAQLKASAAEWQRSIDAMGTLIDQRLERIDERVTGAVTAFEANSTKHVEQLEGRTGQLLVAFGDRLANRGEQSASRLLTRADELSAGVEAKLQRLDAAYEEHRRNQSEQIGELSALHKAFFTQVHATGTDWQRSIDAVGKLLDQRLGQLDERVGGATTTLDSNLAKRMKQLDERIGGAMTTLDGNLAKHLKQIDERSTELVQTLGGRMASQADQAASRLLADAERFSESAETKLQRLDAVEASLGNVCARFEAEAKERAAGSTQHAELSHAMEQMKARVEAAVRASVAAAFMAALAILVGLIMTAWRLLNP